MAIEQQVQEIEADAATAIASAADEAALEAIRVGELGKKGRLSLLMRELGAMSPEQRTIAGPALNGLKDRLTTAISARKADLELAALNSLLGRRDAAVRFLGEFQRMRNQALPYLEQLPDWLVGGLDWAASLKQRAEQESVLLLAERPPTPAELVEKGVLPL